MPERVSGRRSRGQKAWLLLWEWIGDHAAVEDRIAAILRPRLSPRVVGEIVEYLYAIHIYTPTELALWAKRPEDNPYRANWHDGICICGHNPDLNAYYVHDLIITQDPESGLETVSWVIPPHYRWDMATGQKVLLHGEISESVTRTITGPLSGREIGRYP